MTSKIVVNNIEADSGISTVTFNSNISGNFVGNISVSGVTTVAAGSTTAPSISPSGDSNTGIFFPAPDTVAIAEGGVEALRVDSSSNVIVGVLTSTGTASQKLQVTGGAYVSNNLGVGVTNPSALIETTGDVKIGGAFYNVSTGGTINNGASISITVPSRGAGYCYLVSVSRRQDVGDNYQGLYLVHYSANSTPQAVTTIVALSSMTVSASGSTITLTNGLGFVTACNITATRIA